MRTISVRDLRQRWPEAERALEENESVVVTRDGRPVARILPFEPNVRAARASVDWDAVARWRARFWRTQPKQPPTSEDLEADRAERG